jgi:sialic acid synthase SpsE
MEIGKMEALGEEAGWKRVDEGGQAMESLGTEAREERLEAKERVEYRKEKRRIFIKSCTKKGEI